MNHRISFFVINHTSVGGVERVNSKLISLFKKNHLNVYSIISFANENDRNKMIPFTEDLNVKSVRKNELTKDLNHYLTTNKITHLIFQGDNMSISLKILNAIKNTSCKAYLHYHGSPYAYLKKNFYWSDIQDKPTNLFKIIAGKIIYPFKKRKLKKIINNSKDGFITVSDGVKKEINNLYKTKFNNVTSIHNPTSYTLDKEINIYEKDKTIILTSRLVRKHKNVLLALKVWKLIYTKYPDWKFQILGFGVILDQLNEYIHKYQLKNIKIYGYVNNVDDFLKKSAISIVTSDTEGFSMFTYESLLFKNPIITTNSYGGISDMVAHGYNGVFSPRNNAEKMAENLEKLILDKALRIEMGNNSYKKYKELQKEDIITQWKKVLKIN